MKKRFSFVVLLVLVCAFMGFPVFAQDEPTENNYRIFLENYPAGAEFDADSFLCQGIVKAGWSLSLSFSLAVINDGSEVTDPDTVGYLREGERAVKGAYWDAILPDGSIAKPHHFFEEVDPRHDLDENREDWRMECAVFRVPLEMTGTMVVRAYIDGTIVDEFEVTVLDEYISGKKIRGWIWSCKERYYIKKDGTLARGWFRNNGKWYYLNQEGLLQTGWQYLSYNGNSDWYYFRPEGIQYDDLGEMYRGWHEIDGIWYYFRKDGSMAANEWINGYWLSANGSWKYQPKGRWRRNSKGWWYEDERGWYPKGETVKINGVSYTFAEDGYLVE